MLLGIPFRFFPIQTKAIVYMAFRANLEPRLEILTDEALNFPDCRTAGSSPK